jgi:hypothetical protein
MDFPSHAAIKGAGRNDDPQVDSWRNQSPVDLMTHDSPTCSDMAKVTDDTMGVYCIGGHSTTRTTNRDGWPGLR